MAEIEMERRPKRRGWAWVLLVVAIVALGVGAWYVFGRNGGGMDAGTEPPVETRQGPPPPTQRSAPARDSIRVPPLPQPEGSGDSAAPPDTSGGIEAGLVRAADPPRGFRRSAADRRLAVGSATTA